MLMGPQKGLARARLPGLRSLQWPSASPWTPPDLHPSAGLTGGTGAGPRGARDSLGAQLGLRGQSGGAHLGERLAPFLPRPGFGPQYVPSSRPY